MAASRVRALLARGADLLWPRVCLACGRGTTIDPRLCDGCLRRLPRAWGAACRICALPLVAEAEERCLGCRGRRAPRSRLDVAGDYEDPLRALIRALKFGRQRAAARPLASLLRARECAADPARSDRRVDLVVPVPLASARRRERGFNQVELVAVGLAPLFGAAWRPLALERRDGGRQLGRGRRERRQLGASAFRARGVFGARILLVDDVVTTGATLRAASRALRDAGAREVRCLAVARTP